MSQTQWVESIACFKPLWDLAAVIDGELAVDFRSGRPRECKTAEALLFEIATWETGSYRRTERMLKDEQTWERLRQSVIRAFPDDAIRLSVRPISRTQFSNLRDKLALDDGIAAVIRRHIDDMALRAALHIGVFAKDSGSFPHPDESQVIVGDGTWIDGKYNFERGQAIVDKETGEIVGRTRFDSTVRSYHNDQRKAGNQFVLASGRTPHRHERVVLFLDEVPRGKTDARVFTERVVQLAPQVPGLLAAGYDMAARSREVEMMLAAGIHAITKVPRWKGGKTAFCQLGSEAFRLNDGQLKEIVVWAVDGTPAIEVVVDGEKFVQPLERLSSKRDHGKSGYRIYGEWRIPINPAVPPHLQGARTYLRHQTTRQDKMADRSRTNFLRTIPESDADFRRLFGRREDTESTNHHLKSRLTDRRARCVGVQRNLHHMRGYQMLTAITALVAHERRTGVRDPGWFGELRHGEKRRKDAA
jgi:hypothetical protein